jgi:hypothetical protein
MSLGRPTLPFLPIHLKDILFAIESMKATFSDSAHISCTDLQLLVKCIAGALVQSHYTFEPDVPLQDYFRVSICETCHVFLMFLISIVGLDIMHVD